MMFVDVDAAYPMVSAFEAGNNAIVYDDRFTPCLETGFIKCSTRERIFPIDTVVLHDVVVMI